MTFGEVTQQFIRKTAKTGLGWEPHFAMHQVFILTADPPREIFSWGAAVIERIVRMFPSLLQLSDVFSWRLSSFVQWAVSEAEASASRWNVLW